MKNLISVFIFLLPLFVHAQKTHTVAAKESLYSISRTYNVHPRELAAYNDLSINDGLNIGQVIKIPGKKNMEPLSNNAPAVSMDMPVEKPKVSENNTRSTTGSPVYHTVQAKEGLYSIAKTYNVTIAQIKQWNSLENDNISIGTELVVGYNAVAKKPVKKEAQQNAQPVEKPKPAETTAPIVVQENKATNAAPVTPKEPTREVAKTENPGTIAADYKGGYFKPLYDKQVQENAATEESGTAGIFKSTSGWEDGKYYCLHNSAPAGSYIKITNTSNQRSVYAKVLDLIPDLKQNNALIIRISNAAAAVLGVDGTEFNCKLSY